MIKHCKKCGLDKQIEEFYFDKGRNAYVAPCKACRIAIVKKQDHKWRKSHREEERVGTKWSKLRLKYGLTPESMTELWEAQNRACAICHKPLSLSATEKASKPHVDHCHVSGVVRGLLCLTCNTGLGMFGDSLDLLGSATQYLQARQDAKTSIPDLALPLVSDHTSVH